MNLFILLHSLPWKSTDLGQRWNSSQYWPALEIAILLVSAAYSPSYWPGLTPWHSAEWPLKKKLKTPLYVQATGAQGSGGSASSSPAGSRPTAASGPRLGTFPASSSRPGRRGPPTPAIVREFRGQNRWKPTTGGHRGSNVHRPQNCTYVETIQFFEFIGENGATVYQKDFSV